MCVIKIKGEEKMFNTYSAIKQRIENLNNGWDKEGDDILQELQANYNSKDILIFHDDSGKTGIVAVYHFGYFALEEIPNLEDKQPLISFKFTSQCEKLKAFKSALLWLLDHSDIKKDERQEEIEQIKEEIKKLQERLDKIIGGRER